MRLFFKTYLWKELVLLRSLSNYQTCSQLLYFEQEKSVEPEAASVMWVVDAYRGYLMKLANKGGRKCHTDPVLLPDVINS